MRCAVCVAATQGFRGCQRRGEPVSERQTRARRGGGMPSKGRGTRPRATRARCVESVTEATKGTYRGLRGGEPLRLSATMREKCQAVMRARPRSRRPTGRLPGGPRRACSRRMTWHTPTRQTDMDASGKCVGDVDTWATQQCPAIVRARRRPGRPTGRLLGALGARRGRAPRAAVGRDRGSGGPAAATSGAGSLRPEGVLLGDAPVTTPRACARTHDALTPGLAGQGLWV